MCELSKSVRGDGACGELITLTRDGGTEERGRMKMDLNYFPVRGKWKFPEAT